MPQYIPPGYTNVKVFKNPASKVYAYGYDKKGRKQIIYNSWFIEKQRKKRFKHIIGLRPWIKALKDKIQKILGSSKVDVASKQVQIAIILKLLMLCNFRIGNTKYLKEHGSYGLTTLMWKHINIENKPAQLSIEFIGKKGVVNKSVCSDPLVYKLIVNMHQKRKADQVFRVSSAEVNAYLSDFGGMTSKDVRTWHANYLFVKYYKQAEKDGATESKSKSYALSKVAEELHNTPAVCKKNYLLPDLYGQRVERQREPKSNQKPK